ncbi:MAG: metal-dependent hydrolase [Campylobacteraceae bacterium]|jgi:cytosine/adenosine deaminase-related metal-dependent hydrolase|nr:metal-dependent hydrolase [Campylobacteraceae bacterium]
MRLILSDFVLVCDEGFGIIENGGVCFDEKIIAVGDASELLAKYKDAQVERLSENSVLMPGLINSHVHLEFSANVATLKFGDFMSWLRSVIASRDELQSECDEEMIARTLQDILKSGVTTIGAISSFGLDLAPCVKSALNVVYFVEVIGSNPAAIDTLFDDFKARFYEAKKLKSGSFFPAISVHSPYSTHPVLARHALDIARAEGVQTSAHFMEAACEREWLDNGGGAMAEFMKAFNPHSKPMSSAKEFLQLFHDTKTLFVHAVQAKDEELDIIAGQGGSIAHCPRSNALLGTHALDIANTAKHGVGLTLGTDGLSSNISLNLWDEMRAAIFTHQNCELEGLAALLLKSATINGAKALALNKGVLSEGYDADIIALKLPQSPKDISQLPLQIILRTGKAEAIYIGGVKR